MTPNVPIFALFVSVVLGGILILIGFIDCEKGSNQFLYAILIALGSGLFFFGIFGYAFWW